MCNTTTATTTRFTMTGLMYFWLFFMYFMRACGQGWKGL
jgi:hypothetical protein